MSHVIKVDMNSCFVVKDVKPDFLSLHGNRNYGIKVCNKIKYTVMFWGFFFVFPDKFSGVFLISSTVKKTTIFNPMLTVQGLS